MRKEASKAHVVTWQKITEGEFWQAIGESVECLTVVGNTTIFRWEEYNFADVTTHFKGDPSSDLYFKADVSVKTYKDITELL